MTQPGRSPERRRRWHFTQVIESCGIRVLGCGWWYRPALREEANRPWMMDAYGLIHASQPGAVFENDLSARRNLPVGSCALLFPGVRHRYGSLAGWDWEERLLLFDGALVRDLAEQGLLDPHRPIFTPADPIAIQRLLDGGCESAEGGREFDLCPIVFALLHQLTRSNLRASIATEADDSIAAITAHIRREPHKDWDGRRLAASLGMTYSGFRQAFARIVGLPPHRYVLNERIQRACRLLAERDSIAEISREVGIPDPARFARHFRRLIGYSPRDFRAMQARMR